jgi:hypothetical protein
MLTIKKDKNLAKEIINIIEKYVQYLLLKDVKGCYDFLRKTKKTNKEETFVDGLIWGLIENIYNYVGYLIDRN